MRKFYEFNSIDWLSNDEIKPKKSSGFSSCVGAAYENKRMLFKTIHFHIFFQTLHVIKKLYLTRFQSPPKSNSGNIARIPNSLFQIHVKFYHEINFFVQYDAKSDMEKIIVSIFSTWGFPKFYLNFVHTLVIDFFTNFDTQIM